MTLINLFSRYRAFKRDTEKDFQYSTKSQRMRFIIVAFSLLVSISCDKSLILSQISWSKSQTELVKAFSEIFLLELNASIRMITSRENSNLLNLPSLNVPYELLSIDFFSSTNKTKIVTSSYVNAILFRSAFEIFSIFSKDNLNVFRLDGYYMLVSFDECSQKEHDEIFQFLWKLQMFNINLICEINGEILMKTFLPYQRSSCGNTNSITIDKYANGSWDECGGLLRFPSKFKNLFNCQLRVTSFYYPPITMRETLSDGTFRYYGSEMELVSGLSQALNFDVNHNYIEKSGSAGILYDNGTATGILNQTIEGEIDMLMSFYYLTYLRTKFLSFSESHYSVPLVIMVPLGKPFSPFEKLFNPLQFLVWIFLTLTISLGMVAIAIINCQNEKIRSFVLGPNVRTPYLNLFNILLNGIQHALPTRNFARTILMIFMMFCFILRTLYQGSLYQFLQADDRNPEVATIDEMIANDFVVYIRDTLEHNIKHLSFYNR